MNLDRGNFKKNSALGFRDPGLSGSVTRVNGGLALSPENNVVIERHEMSMRRKREIIGKLGKRI